MASASASSHTASHPHPHPRPIAPRPALRPILPKPPAITPAPVPASTATSASAVPATGAATASTSSLAASSLSHLGTRVIGSVASSILAGSTTITLPPRPSASRSKAKKRASPDRVVAPAPAVRADVVLEKKIETLSASQVANLKKRRKAKSDSPATASPASSTPATSAAPSPARAAPPSHAVRHCIAIPHSAAATPKHITNPADIFSGFSDIDNDADADPAALNPSTFTFAANPAWWSADATTVSIPPSSLYMPGGGSAKLAAVAKNATAAAAARRRIDRSLSSSSSSSLSSSMSSTAYFSDSTISTGVSSILMDDSFESSKRVDADISDMIHRLITGDESTYPTHRSIEMRRNSLASIEDEDEEMLFATETDTTSVRRARAMALDGRRKNLADASKQAPLRALLAISPPSSVITSSSSAKSSPSVMSPDSTPAPFTAASAPIPLPRMSLSRSNSEPASITIPAEKNSFEDEFETDFFLNREMLVQKGIRPVTGNVRRSTPQLEKSGLLGAAGKVIGLASSTRQLHPKIEIQDTEISSDLSSHFGIVLPSSSLSSPASAQTPSVASNGRLVFSSAQGGADVEDDEMTSTSQDEEVGSMDIDIDIDAADVDPSDSLFGGFERFGTGAIEDDPFTFLDIGGNEVVESTIGW
ncbi:uncharacterized protein V1518DRAFT_420038 [Limtongia smithiae]|uniref:uncharacterized protein n=1 Tax=Limtongia smithiae TaxID=1125753 RepID=UPI0034CEDA51